MTVIVFLAVLSAFVFGVTLGTKSSKPTAENKKIKVKKHVPNEKSEISNFLNYDGTEQE